VAAGLSFPSKNDPTVASSSVAAARAESGKLLNKRLLDPEPGNERRNLVCQYFLRVRGRA